MRANDTETTNVVVRRFGYNIATSSFWTHCSTRRVYFAAQSVLASGGLHLVVVRTLGDQHDQERVNLSEKTSINVVVHKTLYRQDIVQLLHYGDPSTVLVNPTTATPIGQGYGRGGYSNLHGRVGVITLARLTQYLTEEKTLGDFYRAA